MSWPLTETLGLNEVLHIEYTLDKFLKLCNNVSREIIDWWECKEDWQYHIIKVTEYLYKREVLNSEERNSIFDGSLEIPEIVFLLIEKLIFWYYFTEFEPGVADTSSNSLSYVYAWSTYIRLAEYLWNKTKPYPYWKPNTSSAQTKQTISWLTNYISDEVLENISNQGRRHIEFLAWKLIHILLRRKESQLTHEFLDNFLQILEDYFPYIPQYMKIIHVAFDELEAIQTIYHKNLHILWILVSDFLPWNHELFENASELFLVGIRDKKTHAAVKNICDEKTNAN